MCGLQQSASVLDGCDVVYLVFLFCPQKNFPLDFIAIIWYSKPVRKLPFLNILP